MTLRTPFMLLALLPALVAVWGMRRSVSRTARTLRFLLLVALIVALAQPVLAGVPLAPPLLVLVDQSASLAPQDRAAAWAAAQTLARDRGTAPTTLGAVGQDVRIIPSGALPTVDATGTDLGAALRLAAGWGGHTVLLSDGGATNADTDIAAQQLHQAGVVVDVVPLTATLALDARVTAINLPAGLREGQHFAAEIALASTAATTATLHLLEDGVERSVQPVALKQGTTVVPFLGSLDRAGLHTFRATLDLPDAHPENNSLDQTILIGPTPKVLVIERTPDTAATLRDTLERGGIQSEALRPHDLSPRLSDLQRFDAIVLNDVAATDLSAEQQATLREYVRSLGHGLLAIGGTHSYGLGRYKDTPLETVLPVQMQPQPRRERQQVSLLLIIDHSASMYGADPTTSKLELAKGGALAATQSLMPNDRVGVEVFDTESQYAVPFTAIGDATSVNAIQTGIRSIDLGGGTDIYGALQRGLTDLAQQPTAIKHAVLLTDGRSYTRQSYDKLVGDARAAGITLSTIAIGDDADTELCKQLATLGGGQYQFAANPQELPRLTLEESQIARSDPRVEETLQPEVEGTPAPLRGLIPSQFPTISGYVSTTPKPSADVLLRSPSQDVVLAGWQFGLGRALAWTSDSGAQWATNWQRWRDAPLFWSQLLAYTFPDPASGPLSAQVVTSPSPHIVADALDASGAPLDLADVGARVTAPDGSEQTLRLHQIAPGRYTAPLTATLSGGYGIGVGLRKGTTELSTTTGYVRPYPSEFTRQPDLPLLNRIAQTTGGQLLPNLLALNAFRVAPARPERPLWPWPVAIALVLWPLEVAVRRGFFRRRFRAAR